MVKEFPGEKTPWKKGNLIAIKSHNLKRDEPITVFDRIILLIRNPLDAYLANYNRIRTGNNHTGLLDDFNEKRK